MNYAQRYNTGQLDTAFKNAASMYEIFSGQTDYYDGIQSVGGSATIQAWKAAHVDIYSGGYAAARGGFTSTLTREEIKTALGFVAGMDNIKQSFAPTNINIRSGHWDNPFARYYTEEAPTFTTYEPLAYYTTSPIGPPPTPRLDYLNRYRGFEFSFFDPNIHMYVGQPGPWGTQAMIFENQADNNVFLFYDHFSYDTGNGAILKGDAKFKLKEGRKYTWNLHYEALRLGLTADTGFSGSWHSINSHEGRNKYAIDAIFNVKSADKLVYKTLPSLGFSDWYLVQKPSIGGYGGRASIIVYKDFSEDSFIDDGDSFIFAEIENPQSLQGSLVDCLCRNLEGKRVGIDSLWITQKPIKPSISDSNPSGDSSIVPVKHYPSSFDGIASFENKFPDHIAYPKKINRTALRVDHTVLGRQVGAEATKEYGHSFPESPSLDFVTDVNGQGMPQQILVGTSGESASYYPNGHTGSGSATKQDYDSSKQLKTQTGTGEAFTQKDSISLIYPDGSIGKTTENGVWNNTYDNFRYFIQSTIGRAGVSHRFKGDDPYITDTYTGSYYKFTYPANHSSKFGESFRTLSSFSSPWNRIENFFNLEPLHFNKHLLPLSASSNYTGARLKNQYITKSSAASSHNHSEHYRSNETQNNYPSAVDTLYHINTVNFKTGTFKLKKLDTEAFTSSDVFEFDGRISVTKDKEYFSLPRGEDFLVIQPSTPFVSRSGYRSPAFAHQISVEFDPNHYPGSLLYSPRHIRYFEENGSRFFMTQALLGDWRYSESRKKKINWQTQKLCFNAYDLQTFDFFSDPIFYAGDKYSAYPLNYEDVTLNLGTSDLGVPTLNVFGAAQINSEIVNYSPRYAHGYIKSGLFSGSLEGQGYTKNPQSNYLGLQTDRFHFDYQHGYSVLTGEEYHNLYQETNSDWELDANQVIHPTGIDIDPVLRWGIQDGRFEEEAPSTSELGITYSGLDNRNNVADFGSQLIKNVPTRGAAYLDFKAGYDQRILNLNNLPRVYGTPHSVKHLNVGNVFSHPDITYYDLNVSSNSASQGGIRIEFETVEIESKNINYRLEFSGFTKAYGGPAEDKTVINNPLLYPKSYNNSYRPSSQSLPQFPVGSFNREYDETFYKYADDGTLSIEISVRRRYKNRRPNQPDRFRPDMVAVNYSRVIYDSIFNGYASHGQNHFFGGIDDALKISTSGYLTRIPYEAYDANTYSPVPTERRGEQYNWHIINGMLDPDQEEARRRL